MKLAVIGTGYVGLVSGVCFSEFGHNVVCVDNVIDRIGRLRNGEMPIYEPGLKALAEKGVQAGCLHFTTELDQAVSEADIVFIAVGTPTRRGDGHADIEFVVNAAKQIARALVSYTVIVIKSTVPVGTGRRIEGVISENAPPGIEFDIVSNPEFLREGAALEDFARPDRIVIGTDSERARLMMAEVYRPLNLPSYSIMYCEKETAELIKYASNAFLAAKITFMNEIAELCEKVGADVMDVANGVGLDHRIGSKFLEVGPGFGGSCFPKDTKALIQMGDENGAPQRITKTVVEANDHIRQRMIQKIVDCCDGLLSGKRIAILGVTFKPDTDDMREAASLTIVPALHEAGASVRLCDPKAEADGKLHFPYASWADDPYETASGSDVIVVLTQWHQFRALDLKRLVDTMRTPRMVDLRNVYNPSAAFAAGFERYIGVGR